MYTYLHTLSLHDALPICWRPPRKTIASSHAAGFCVQVARPTSARLTIQAWATSQTPRHGEARVSADHVARSKKRSGGKRRTAGIPQYNKLRSETKAERKSVE